MTLRADPTLLPEIKRFGAFDINACFNCGNCTAICPLSKDNDAFPRRLIRYAQIGLPDHLASSKELWLCHYCGDCSETCPRQAEPGEFMAAARRYAISRLDPTGIARFLTLSPAMATVALAGFAGLLAALLLAFSPLFSRGMPTVRFSTSAMLRFVPYELIHWGGIAVLAFVALTAMATVANLVWSLSHASRPTALGPLTARPGMFPLRSTLRAVKESLAEVFGHKSFRSCNDATSTPDHAQAWYLRPWVVHLSIMLGFLGLWAATSLDYVLKDPYRHVPIWAPIRLLGTLAGILFLYGTTSALVGRLRRSRRRVLHTRYADWLLLWMLWLTGMSGFAIEMAIYLDIQTNTFLYAIFLFHIVAAMELLLILPFSKFSHALYRPIALFLHAFRQQTRARSGVHEERREGAGAARTGADAATAGLRA